MRRPSDVVRHMLETSFLLAVAAGRCTHGGGGRYSPHHRLLLFMRFFLVFMRFIPFSFMLGIENYALIYAFFGGLCATSARFSRPF